MERRAASHTEEEEMNQRRRLLNAAKKGDQKAVAKLFELYQVRVYSSEMVSKLNRTAGTHKLQAEVAQSKMGKGKGASKQTAQKTQRTQRKVSHKKSKPGAKVSPKKKISRKK
ncbi:hypothetical protein [Petrachloros mirabilis]